MNKTKCETQKKILSKNDKATSHTSHKQFTSNLLVLLVILPKMDLDVVGVVDDDGSTIVLIALFWDEFACSPLSCMSVSLSTNISIPLESAMFFLQIICFFRQSTIQDARLL